jgi:hypothetical protein
MALVSTLDVKGLRPYVEPLNLKDVQQILTCEIVGYLSDSEMFSCRYTNRMRDLRVYGKRKRKMTCSATVLTLTVSQVVEPLSRAGMRYPM